MPVSSVGTGEGKGGMGVGSSQRCGNHNVSPAKIGSFAVRQLAASTSPTNAPTQAASASTVSPG